MINPFSLSVDSLATKLLELDLKNLKISDYSKNYLLALLVEPYETLGRFSQVLNAAYKQVNKPLDACTFVDYGGGVGLLSLLACESGIKQIIFNDIFQGSCQDAKALSEYLGFSMNHFIQGDADELVSKINNLSINIDAVVSYDVIEHVYDVEKNFLSFKSLNHLPKTLIYGSGANIKNPFYTIPVKKIQKKVELSTRSPEFGHKPSDSLDSYLSIRSKIIYEEFPELDQETVTYLSVATRGLRSNDIIKEVVTFIQTGSFNYVPTHPTNTCDPLTGNWCEQLIPFKTLKKIAIRTHYVPILNKGFYTLKTFRLKNLPRYVFNTLSRSLGPFGFHFSPFYILILSNKKS